MTTQGIGARVRRTEDPRFLSGTGRYVDDLHRPGMVHMAVVRSPHAHARLAAIDPAPALALPGVSAVFTFADLPPTMAPIPSRMPMPPGPERFLQYPLARDRVRYVGEPVAIVVARDRYLAEDAAALVRVTYEPLPVAASVEAAMAAGAPRVHDAAEGNIAATRPQRVGDFERARAEADLVISERLATNRHTASPMETRGLLFEYDAGQRQLSGWGPAKCNHINRGILARLLGLPESRIHLFEPDVGGGFGARGEIFPEDILVPFAAMRVGRPVKWIEDRREHFLGIHHSREQYHEVTLALRRDGTILGLHDRFAVDMGAYIRIHGVLIPELTAALLPGPYRVPNYSCDYYAVLTNKTPIGTYRAPGLFESNFVCERLLEMAAARLGLDPAAIRLRNLIGPEEIPYRPGTTSLGYPLEYDAGDFPAGFRRVLDHVEYGKLRAEQAGLRAQGVYRGIGICSYLQKTGLGPHEGATIRVDPEGEVVILTGASSVGQGLETVLAQIAQETLGVGLDRIAVRHGNTDDLPYGTGSYGGRATVMAGSAVFRAAERIREKAFALAERHLEAAQADLELVDGAVRVRGTPARAVSLGDLARLARPDGPGAALGLELGLQDTAYFTASRMAYANGVALVVVDVDPETGAVRIVRCVGSYDVGRAVNPTLIEGQVTGAVIQGVGGALYEHLAYDADGQLLATSFMDYLVPTAAEAPPVEVLIGETPTPLNPLRLKGAGESGIGGMGAALANAVADALAPLGAHVTRLPLDPAYLAGLVRAAGTIPSRTP